MIIVSNLQRLKERRRLQLKNVLLFGILGLITVILLAVYVPLVRYFLVLGAVLIPLVIFGVIRPGTRFECYTDAQEDLHFVFTDNKEEQPVLARSGRYPALIQALLGRTEHMVIRKGTLWGYESHSFFSKEQALICLLLRTRDGLIRTRSIPVEYLDENEKRTLYAFLDAQVIHNKRGIIDHGQQYPAPIPLNYN